MSKPLLTCQPLGLDIVIINPGCIKWTGECGSLSSSKLWCCNKTIYCNPEKLPHRLQLINIHLSNFCQDTTKSTGQVMIFEGNYILNSFWNYEWYKQEGSGTETVKHMYHGWYNTEAKPRKKLSVWDGWAHPYLNTIFLWTHVRKKLKAHSWEFKSLSNLLSINNQLSYTAIWIFWYKKTQSKCHIWSNLLMLKPLQWNPRL